MQNTGVNQFLEKYLCNNFIPQMTLPTRTTQKTATLIDNIFTNSSHHLPQFLSIENLKQLSIRKKSSNLLQGL